MAVNGECTAQFAGVRQVFEQQIASSEEVGASYAVWHGDKLAVDLWGGDRDTNGNPWERDTIVNVYSTTKTVCTAICLMLHDAGLLDFDKPVSHYWPEFAANGKDNVLMSHIMSHSAGLCAIEEPVSSSDIYDHDKIASLLAAQPTYWEPGTQVGYHALTQGFLIGEVVRRITGKTIGTFLRENIAEPAGIDFQIGVPASEDARIAELVPHPPEESMLTFEEGSIGAKTWTNPAIDLSAGNTRDWRVAEIPAGNGHGNARSVATLQSALVNGGQVNGVKLFSEATARLPLEEQARSLDPCLGFEMCHGMGFGHMTELLPLSPDANTVFWGGLGGSSIIINYDRQLVLCYAMNKMSPLALGDPRSLNLHNQVWDATN